MSLDSSETARTASELRANFVQCGMTAEQVASDLGFTATQLDDALRSSADPADVWLLRDYLEQAIRLDGGEPVPFTILTEGHRAAANGWFGLRDAPVPSQHR